MNDVWIPDYSSKHSGEVEGTLLYRAIVKCVNKFGLPVLHRYQDDFGCYGVLFPRFILCAKKESYGWVVSCHKSLLEACIKKDVPLLMYILKSDTFYYFDPRKALEGATNLRAGIEFVNFPVEEGVKAT